jgi:hypothetical protein
LAATSSPALVMPDLDVRAAEVGQHRRRNVSGVCARVRRVNVLGAPADPAAGQPIAGDPDRGEGEKDEDLAIDQIVEERSQRV